VLYELAAGLGRDRLRRIVHRMPLIDWRDVDRAEDWFERHGTAAVFLGRFVPGVRSLISVPAGTSSMSRGRFTLFTAIGSAIWNGAFIAAGWALGSAWTSVGRYRDWINWGVLAVAVALTARFVWRRRDRLPWRRHDPDGGTGDAPAITSNHRSRSR
jgi:membrane protein DedA with SNARE-associated domain